MKDRNYGLQSYNKTVEKELVSVFYCSIIYQNQNLNINQISVY